MRSGLFPTVLLLSFPFSVLFCPPVNLLLFYARIDEVLVLAFVPVAAIHYLSHAFRNYRKVASPHFVALFILFAVFLLGLFHGGGNWQAGSSYWRWITRPLALILAILVLRYWLHRGLLKFNHYVTGIVVAVALAGALGYFAMHSPELADTLVRVYSAGIEAYDDNYSFDMSRRAMSVFTGYDQASIAFAIGFVLTIYLYVNSGKKWKIPTLVTMCVMAVAILASARVGIVSALAGGSALWVLRQRGRLAGFVVAVLALILAISAVIPFAQLFIQNPETIARLKEFTGIFDFWSSTPFIDRSQGLRGMVDSQILDVSYPKGLEAVIGFGDDTRFVSDLGIVTVYVKYGVIGMVVLACVYAVWVYKGLQTSGMILAATRQYMPFSTTLPALVALFVVGNMKGGLYFLTYKLSELFAFVLALVIVEGEIAVAYSRKRRFKRLSIDTYLK
jgi:hypothetical protein